MSLAQANVAELVIISWVILRPQPLQFLNSGLEAMPIHSENKLNWEKISKNSPTEEI